MSYDYGTVFNFTLTFVKATPYQFSTKFRQINGYDNNLDDDFVILENLAFWPLTFVKATSILNKNLSNLLLLCVISNTQISNFWFFLEIWPFGL